MENKNKDVEMLLDAAERVMSAMSTWSVISNPEDSEKQFQLAMTAMDEYYMLKKTTALNEVFPNLGECRYSSSYWLLKLESLLKKAPPEVSLSRTRNHGKNTVMMSFIEKELNAPR